jgi:hypothetical protein
MMTAMRAVAEFFATSIADVLAASDDDVRHRIARGGITSPTTLPPTRLLPLRDGVTTMPRFRPFDPFCRVRTMLRFATPTCVVVT